MTPLVAVIVVLGGTSSALVRMPVPGHDLFDSYVAIVNLITLSIAIALLDQEHIRLMRACLVDVRSSYLQRVAAETRVAQLHFPSGRQAIH